MTSDYVRVETREHIRTLAAGIREADLTCAADRLLERIAASADCERMRSLLLEMGAATLLRDLRA